MARISDMHKTWMKESSYRKTYAALEEEFVVASTAIDVRSRAGLTQEALAQKMGTTQPVVARLESGRGRPSMRTLDRLAKATGSRLIINFAPIENETKGPNVFNDLGVRDSDEHLVKAQLVFKIDTIIKKRRLKQVEAAELFGVRQPDVSKMLRGEFRQFSVERLLRFLVALDQDVEILVRPSNSPALHVS
jgi:predicted XRE-type DNA-binding protein/DNA-binding XRE family transcriptional regulator